MKAMSNKKKYRILVLDDSEFYNMLLTRQLENFTETLKLDHDLEFEIQSYTNVEECLAKMKPDTHIAFVDYYLGKGITGSDVIKKLKQKCRNCKVIIISQNYSIKTALKTITEGAIEFILKDREALSKCCFVLNDFVHGRLAAHLPR